MAYAGSFGRLSLLLALSLCSVLSSTVCDEASRRFWIEDDAFWKDGAPFEIIAGDTHYFRIVLEGATIVCISRWGQSDEPSNFWDMPTWQVEEEIEYRSKNWDDGEDGKWTAPTIPNPEYKGPWIQKDVKAVNAACARVMKA